ncbi:MAG: hypothetical protein NVS1B6_12720 [Steroidobacteraceae bacterium]
MKDAAFQKAFGISVDGREHTPDVVELIPQVRQTVAGLPIAHRQLLKGNTMVSIVSMIDLTGQKTTTGVVGVGAAAGLYSSNGVVQVAAMVRGANGEDRKARTIARTTSHEMGHAIDRRLGDVSSNKPFAISCPPPGQRGTPIEEQRGAYHNLLPSEVWAECYAAEFDPFNSGEYFHSMSRERAREVYAKPIAVMKKIIADGLLRKGIAL